MRFDEVSARYAEFGPFLWGSAWSCLTCSALSPQTEDVRVVQEAVQHSKRRSWYGRDVAPFLKGDVAGHVARSVLIAQYINP